MTSSYNLHRRRATLLERQNIYSIPHAGYMTTWGICPSGHTTHPINNCTDAKICIKEPASDPPSSHCKNFNYKCGPQSISIPNETRAWYNKHDYTQVPYRFDGTGYEPVGKLKYPAYTEAIFKADPKWQSHRLVQPYLIQKAMDGSNLY